MTKELLEEVCKRLEGLDGSGWSANNDENPTSYAVLLGRYYKNPMLGFFVSIEKELWDLGRPDNYYIKIRHSNSLNPKITLGGPDSKPEEVRINPYLLMLMQR